MKFLNNSFKMNQVEIFKTKDGETQIEVQFDDETVWLSQLQMTSLFKQTKQNISLHINNLFKEGELARKGTVKESLTVQKEGSKRVSRVIEFYNLDVIISVGYRVKSKRGTQFRIWATQRLKEYLVQGYSINQKRLEQLQKTIQFISEGRKTEDLNLTEAKGLLEIISNYTRSLVVLSKYDSQSLEAEGLNKNITYEIKYSEAVAAIEKVKKTLVRKKEASALFGNQKDDSFKGILGNIIQSFGGEYLYPSIEEQAAHLLYFVIKNHPFTDGNKRIGAFMFVWFLDKNKHLVSKTGNVKINESALVALALLVAQSNPNDKELMIKLIMNLINQ